MIENSTVVKMSKIALLVAVLIFSTSIACASVNNATVNETAIESLIQDLADQQATLTQTPAPPPLRPLWFLNYPTP